MTQEEKAKAYDEAIRKAKALYDSAEPMSGCNVLLETVFPELKESEDEQHRKWILEYLYDGLRRSDEQFKGQFKAAIAWLEKQGEQNEIFNVPSREVILSIWDLGNEWKELTKGSISTEYGTQLDYIQKHWRESEYYLRAKQSEQKPYGQRAECLDCQFNYAGECKGSCAMKRIEQKPADKPKFKVEKGKWYICIKDLLDNYANKAFRKGDTYLSTQDGSLMPSNSNVPFEVVCPDTYFRDWTIQDATDGDVLASELCDSIILFRGIKDDNIDFYCDYDFSKIDIPGDRFAVNNGQHYGNVEDSKDFHPATKEQRDTLLKAMVDAGYKWDSENKILLSLKEEPNSEQKLIEWSEEDERHKNTIIRAIHGAGNITPIDGELAEKWLKSLRLQKRWKPADKVGVLKK